GALEEPHFAGGPGHPGHEYDGSRRAAVEVGAAESQGVEGLDQVGAIRSVCHGACAGPPRLIIARAAVAIAPALLRGPPPHSLPCSPPPAAPRRPRRPLRRGRATCPPCARCSRS